MFHRKSFAFTSQSRKRQNANRRTSRNGFRRTLAVEVLEPRQMLSVAPLQSASWSQGTGEKPQSKVFEYAGQWWTVMPNSSGTWVYRLNGTSWQATQQITSSTSVHADVKLVGDIAHVLLYNGSSSQLASLQYVAADNRFEPWAARPQLAKVSLSSGVETATLEVDSTGRMWVASDASSTVEVRYSDGNYSTWSAPITVGSGITSDDISAIIALPNHSIGVMWSNQNSKRFGFRVHQDGDAPTAWSADEVPAGQSARNVGGGMADDHVHLAAASDGTLYAAVKTSYDSSGNPKIALLVRRPNAVWDNLYSVDGDGTRPIVVVDEAANKVVVAYTGTDGGGSIVYRDSPLGNISLGPRQTLISGSLNDVTSSKQTSTSQIVFLADNRSAMLSYDTVQPPPPPTNHAPVASAGQDLAGVLGIPVQLDGTVTDDGLPSPPSLITSWTEISGPGTVTFGNSASVDTTADFSATGTYVLRLSASDGALIGSDDVTVNVTSTPPPPPNSGPVQIAFQDGLFPSLSYAGTRDTLISSSSSSSNYGNSQTIKIDGDPDSAALLKWDISAIPAGSIIVSAEIDLNVTSSTADHYEAYVLQKAWDELSATWQRYATNQSWSSAGAKGAADHDSTVLGKIGPASTGLYRMSLNSAGVAAIQAWLDNSAPNYGIILQNYSMSDGVDISTRETSSKSLRPKLVINYQQPGQSLRLSRIEAGAKPTVEAGSNQTIVLGQSATLKATVDNLVNIVWTKTFGPGNVTFGSPTSKSTSAQFSNRGVYKLRITVNDGFTSSFDELQISVV
jgi:hypothetical protein